MHRLLVHEANLPDRRGVGAVAGDRTQACKAEHIRAAAETVLEEVREERLYALAVAGEALREAIGPVVEAFVRRLREDALVPRVTELRKANLEDHVTVFLADGAQALIALEESDIDVADLVRDGTEIQPIIAELHGA